MSPLRQVPAIGRRVKISEDESVPEFWRGRVAFVTAIEVEMPPGQKMVTTISLENSEGEKVTLASHQLEMI